ncbi:MAG: T9SS type A sorting domain-containing protein [Candidatus Kapabacteria bacterium]|nr:T9SS type A sorting domain-containing protein [Candidatus Kapabacteria bacterium]
MKQFLTISIQIFIFSVGICFSQPQFNWEYSISNTTKFSNIDPHWVDTTYFNKLFGAIIRPSTNANNVTSVILETNKYVNPYFFINHDNSTYNVNSIPFLADSLKRKNTTLLYFGIHDNQKVAEILQLRKSDNAYATEVFCVDCKGADFSNNRIPNLPNEYELYCIAEKEKGIITIGKDYHSADHVPIIFSQPFDASDKPKAPKSYLLSKCANRNWKSIYCELNSTRNLYALVIGNYENQKIIPNNQFEIRYFDTTYSETVSKLLHPNQLGYPNDTLFPLAIHHVANEVVVTGSVRHQGMMFPFVCYFDEQGNKVRHSVIPKDTKLISSAISKDNSSVLLVGGRTEEQNPNSLDFYIANFNAKTREYTETIWGQADSNDRLGDVYADIIDSVYITGGINDNLYVANIRLLVPVSVKESQNQEDNSTISIYPNPSKDFITVRFSKTLDNPKIIEILSIDGKVMFLQKLSENSSENAIQLSVSNLPSGSYVLTLRSKKNDVHSKSFIIER